LTHTRRLFAPGRRKFDGRAANVGGGGGSQSHRTIITGFSVKSVNDTPAKNMGRHNDSLKLLNEFLNLLITLSARAPRVLTDITPPETLHYFGGPDDKYGRGPVCEIVFMAAEY